MTEPDTRGEEGSGAAASAGEGGEPVRVKRPWWLPHFLGRVPLGLEKKHVSLIGVIALAGFFENYDLSMLTSAFKQIRESFGLDPSEMTAMVAWVRLGAIPAFLILPLADRLGRRQSFLGAVVGMSIGTFITGLAATPLQFVVAQTLTRTFLVAAIATSVVIVAEEVPAEHRGWGVGMLSAIGSIGFGLGALLYAFVEILPFGWRFLYFVGAAPLLLIPLLRRRVPETARFERMKETAAERGAGFGAPMVELVRSYPYRSLAVAAMGMLFAAGASPAFGLLSEFVQSTHGWSTADYSLMALIAGGVGVIGNLALGRLADRFGRRPVAATAFGLFPLAAAAIYLGPSTAIPLLWIPLVFILTGGNVLMRNVTTELFPTSSRNTAMGWETLCETLGASFGFMVVGILSAPDSSIRLAVSMTALLTVVAAMVVWTLPETARHELEKTSEADPPRASA